MGGKGSGGAIRHGCWKLADWMFLNTTILLLHINDNYCYFWCIQPPNARTINNSESENRQKQQTKPFPFGRIIISSIHYCLLNAITRSIAVLFRVRCTAVGRSAALNGAGRNAASYCINLPTKVYSKWYNNKWWISAQLEPFTIPFSRLNRIMNLIFSSTSITIDWNVRKLLCLIRTLFNSTSQILF